MNNRIIIILLLCGVVLNSGCQRRLQRPSLQPKKNYRPVTSESTVDPARQDNVPKRIQPTQPVIMYDSAQESPKKEHGSFVTIGFVEERLDSYRKKLEKWKEYDSQSSVLNLDQEATEQMVGCFRDLQRMMNGYQRLHDMLSDSTGASLYNKLSSDEIQALQESDVRLLESSCGRILVSEKGMETLLNQNAGRDLETIESLIGQSFQNKEYEQVVQLWLEIAKDQVDQITVPTKLRYGRSLMFLHQEQKAALVYEQVIRDMGQEETPDVLELHRILSNLYLASRNYAAAAGQYRMILQIFNEVQQSKEWAEEQQAILKNPQLGEEQLAEYSSVLRNYMGYVASQDGYKPVWQAVRFLKKYPESPVMMKVDRIKSEVSREAEGWFKKLIADIDALQLQQNYRDALVLLETIPRDIIGPDQVEVIDKKGIELNNAEEAVRESIRIEQMQTLKDRWAQMLSSVERGDYDDAIKQLHSMENSEYHERVGSKLDEVALLAAKKNRQEAARLFISAAKTSDAEEKKRYLIESHQLLMAITLKYPQTRIIDKVIDNMRTVEAEIEKIDPTLVEWSRMAIQQDVEMEKESSTQPLSTDSVDDGVDDSPIDYHSSSNSREQNVRIDPNMMIQ